MNVRRIASFIFLAVLVSSWFVFLRPQSLGGNSQYILVRGTSMLPTYKTGDLVIVRRAPAYKKGDVIAYHVPKGDLGAGIVVIHRIIGGSATRGFVLQGDNNDFTDDWHPTMKDVVGTPFIYLPRVGIMLAFLHQPAPLAALATSIAVVFVLFPAPKKTEAFDTEDEQAPKRYPVLSVVPCIVHEVRFSGERSNASLR